MEYINNDISLHGNPEIQENFSETIHLQDFPEIQENFSETIHLQDFNTIGPMNYSSVLPSMDNTTDNFYY